MKLSWFIFLLSKTSTWTNFSLYWNLLFSKSKQKMSLCWDLSLESKIWSFHQAQTLSGFSIKNTKKFLILWCRNPSKKRNITRKSWICKLTTFKNFLKTSRKISSFILKRRSPLFPKEELIWAPVGWLEIPKEGWLLTRSEICWIKSDN